MASLPSPRDQAVELLVKASTGDKARTVVLEVTGYTLNATITRHSPGYYVISDVFSLDDLNGNFYSKIKASDSLAILSDSSQKVKRDIVLEEAEKVENQLRKLLLRANGFIEDYYNLFIGPYTSDHAKNQTAIMPGDTDPITSLLTFDTMVKILDTDISWSQLSVNTPKDILRLIEGADDLTSLKKHLAEKIKTKRVWDVISESVLVKQYTWKEVAGKIRKIKDLRNRAAHFQILTDKDVKDAQQSSKTILVQLGESNQKPQEQISYVQLPGIQEWLQGLTSIRTEIAQVVAVAREAQLAQIQMAADTSQALGQSILSQLQSIQTASAIESMLAQLNMKPKKKENSQEND